jgi:hypothetical protein
VLQREGSIALIAHQSNAPYDDFLAESHKEAPMPLDYIQLKKIEKPLENILYFPPEADLLRTNVTRLYQSFFNESNDSFNELAGLHGYLAHPESYLTQDDDDTLIISEFKHAIIDWITRKIMDAAKRARLSTQELDWKPTEVLARITKPTDSQHLFKPADVTASFVDSIKIDIRDTATYQAELYREGANLYLMVTMKSIRHYAEQTTILHTLPDNLIFQNKKQEEQYIDSYMALGKEKARELATDITYRHLQAPINKRPLSIAKQKLITHQYYFSALEKKILSLALIENLSDEQITLLLTSTMVEFLKKDAIEMDILLALSIADLNLISHPYYANLIHQYHGVLIQLIHLTEPQQHLLCLPIIIELIRSEKLSLEEAKMLPAFLIKLITDPFYSQKLLVDKPDWKKIISINEAFCTYLLNHSLIAELRELNAELDELLTIAFLLYQQNSLLQSLSPSQIKRALDDVNKTPCLKSSLRANLITFEECATQPPEECGKQLLSRRVFAIFKLEPCVLNNTNDSLALISQDTKSIATYLNLSLPHLKDAVLLLFFSLLTQELEHRISSANIAAKSYYTKFKRTLITAWELSRNNKTTETCWQEMLTTIIKMAKKTLGDLPKTTLTIDPQNSHSATLFGQPPTHIEIERLRHFCDALITLDALYAAETITSTHTYAGSRYN